MLRGWSHPCIAWRHWLAKPVHLARLMCREGIGSARRSTAGHARQPLVSQYPFGKYCVYRVRNGNIDNA